MASYFYVNILDISSIVNRSKCLDSHAKLPGCSVNVVLSSLRYKMTIKFSILLIKLINQIINQLSCIVSLGFNKNF